MKEEIKSWNNFKKWLVIQKVTLLRGYGWCQTFLMGFLAASQLKLLFPNLFDGIYKFIILIILTIGGLWTVGYIDKRMQLLHAENAYATETNPILMKMASDVKKRENQNETE